MDTTIWYLTKNKDFVFQHWHCLLKKYMKASLDLLRTLVEEYQPPPPHTTINPCKGQIHSKLAGKKVLLLLVTKTKP